MSRAAFLPVTGDPYVLYNCLKYFYDVWSPEVDKLYLAVCSTVDQSTIFNVLRDLANHPKISLIYVDHILAHGDAIDVILSQCNEDYVVLVEDDAFIHKPGVVDHYFSLLENNTYDLIGSERTSCTPNLIELARTRWSLDFSGLGDNGPAFWPCFLWTKTEYLKKTDRIFRNYKHPAGTNLFGTVLTEDAVGDTFVWASLQLREQGLRILKIPQYHCSPLDWDQVVSWGPLVAEAKYMHTGSLSSGIQSFLLDSNGIALSDLNNASARPSVLRIPATEQEVYELERRVAWWKESYSNKTLPEDRFTIGYKHALENVIKVCGLSDERINRWIQIYMEKING